MKISTSALDALAALLAVSAVAAFVPEYHKTDPKLPRMRDMPFSSTTCFATETIGPESESSVTFPFNDRQVRFAYDEWRLIYNKGDFDSERFKQFKRNHRTLTISNLKAREKAAQDGRPMPQWMSLNEYGDYSMEEYEAMMRGEQPTVNGEAGAPQSAEQPVDERQQAQGRATIRVQDDYAKNYQNGQVQEYQDQFGRTIRSTQALHQNDPMTEVDSNYANNIEGTNESPSSSEKRGTLIIPKEAGGVGERGTQVIGQRGTQAIGQRGTQVIGQQGTQAIGQRGTQAIGQRGTQVIGQQGSPAIGQRGTQVINQARGTQVINTATSARGTQVINPSSAPRGTQLVNPASPVRGTQVVASSSSTSGTQVIQPINGGSDAPIGGNDSRGTQRIPSSSGAVTPSDEDPVSPTDAGTQIIPSSDSEDRNSVDLGGTIVVDKDDTESWSDILGKLFSDPKKNDDEDEDEIGSRGTMVIKRSITLPEKEPMKNPFSFFGSSKKEQESTVDEEPVQEGKSSDGNPFFNFGSSVAEKEEMTETDEEPVEKEKSSTGSSFFGFGSSSTADEKSVDADVEPMPKEEPSAGNSFFSFMSPKSDKVAAETTEQATEEQEDVGSESAPSGGGIFSFFGGSVKSADSRSVRATITMQKPPSPAKTASTASMAQRKTELIPAKESADGMPSILSFFGGAKKVDEEENARDPNARPTLIVTKPKKKQPWSSFSLGNNNKKTEKDRGEAPAASTTNKNDVIAKQIARQREGVERAARRREEVAREKAARQEELKQKRLEATRLREAKAKQRAGKGAGTRAVAPGPASKTPSSSTSSSSSPFRFFGAVGRQAAPPTLKRWKQNRDGTITGLIYDSKSFPDGTRITTSPIPKGAKSGAVVKTAGGSKYSLT